MERVEGFSVLYEKLIKRCRQIGGVRNANNGGRVDIEAVGGSSGSPIFIKGENSRMIGVINKTVMDNPFSSANIGEYIDAYKLLELRGDRKYNGKVEFV